MLFVIDIFWNVQFLKHFISKSCRFLSAEFRVLVRDMEMNDLRFIFDQWPKQHLEFDVEPEIWILKVIYYKVITVQGVNFDWCGFCTLEFCPASKLSKIQIVHNPHQSKLTP